MESNKSLNRPWTKFYKKGRVSPNLTYPSGSMYDALKASTLKYPDNLAYQYMDLKVTHKEFLEQINNCARALKKQGVTSDDIVTICMPNTPQAIIMFYAVNMIGAIANMIHPLSGEKEIEKFLKDTESRYVLTIDISYKKVLNVLENTKVETIILTTAADPLSFSKSAMYDILKGQMSPMKKIKQIMLKIFDNITILSWKKFIESGKSYKYDPYVKKESQDPAIILYSGGTSGSPKGILLSNLNFNALATQSFLMVDPITAEDKVLTIMPIFHGFGLGVCIHTSLIFGASCILVPRLENNKLANLIRESKPTVIVGVPTLFEALTNHKDFLDKDLSSIKAVISGGDILSNELKTKTDKYLKAHGSKAKVRVGYGLTESSAASCLTPTNRHKNGTIGIPFPDTYYKIVKIGTHDEAETNTDGEICISGPTVMMGYYNNPKETMQALRIHEDGRTWLHTGDIGSMDEEGYVFFKTRLKRMIVSSGYNLYPQYIEEVIDQHKAVYSSIVIGVDDKYRGQHAKAYIILNKGYEENEELRQSIYEHCKKHLAKYSIPREFEFKKELPKTMIGKISYTALEKENKKNK